jgi:hypothetical protein
MAHSWLTIFLAILGGLILLMGLLTLGLVVRPRPFRAHPAPSRQDQRAPMAPGLPDAVRRHFNAVLGEGAPVIQSAVVWGRGRANINGVWIPLRFKAWYRPGVSFSRRMEFTFFMRPVMRSMDGFAGGKGRLEMGERAETGAWVDQAQALALWSEAVWMPSVLVHDPRIRWDAAGENAARLVFPLESGPESLMAYFDSTSGLLTHFTAQRYTVESDGAPGAAHSTAGAPPLILEPWHFDLLEWKRFQGLLLPSQVSLARGETGTPWLYWSLDGVAYNVNVSDQLGEG